MKPNEHYMDYTGSSVYCQSQIEQVRQCWGWCGSGCTLHEGYLLVGQAAGWLTAQAAAFQ